MKSFLLLLGTSLLCIPAIAQMSIPERIPGFRTVLHPAGARIERASSDTVRILALRVQFLPDNDPRTSGNGTFELQTPSPAMIDPPPRDSAYFASKLLFLENYFAKVSDGSLTLRGDMFPGVVSLPDSMAAYSPVLQGGNSSLATLVSDGWTAADAMSPAFPFGQYDAFILFHAGVGRDIDVISILGFEPTPYDLPSVYLNLDAMRELRNDPSYPGVAVNGSTFHIENSLILPETETRVFDLTTGVDTLQLSINGISAASVGSYLGLPDLFDTRTGRSGIGQFGLMDGAAIFAYNGLFPPEPSAWEKAYLGWLTPIQVTGNSNTVSLSAVGFTTPAGDTVLKIPVTASEYYLIENRHRDPDGNGQLLTLLRNGSIIQRHFTQDTTGFSFADVSGISGSLLDAEDFDWALPGATGQEGFEGGGLLVWHIDEDIIARELPTNSVNANPALRGVDLEEADGSQDIGEPYEFLEPGSGTEFGWPLDAWFDGNVTPIYRNVFDANSYPNSNANSGGATLVTLRDFSVRSPRMSVTINVGNPQISRLDEFSKILSSTGESSPPSVTMNTVAATRGSSVYVFDVDGSSRLPDSTGLLASTGGAQPIGIIERGNQRSVLAGAQDSTLYLWDLLDTNSDGVFDSSRVIQTSVGAVTTTPPVLFDSSQSLRIGVGTAAGTVALFDSTGARIRTVNGPGGRVYSVCLLPVGGGGGVSELYATSADALFGESASVSLGTADSSWQVIGVVSTSGRYLVVAETGGSRVLAFDETLQTSLFATTVSDGSISGLSAADLNGDGKKEILVSAGRTVTVLNEAGVIVEGFPRSIPGGAVTSGSAMVGDVTGDGKVEVVQLSSAGDLVAFSPEGNNISFLPLRVLPDGTGWQALFRTTGGNVGLLALSTEGVMSAYELNASYQSATMIWTQEFANAAHGSAESSIVGSPVPISPAFFPRERVYNWPNPVYGSETKIRFYVSTDATMSISIYDLTGLKVAELTGRAFGGIDGEIPWDVSTVQSGVYIARVEAASSVKSEVIFFKIAVVK